MEEFEYSADLAFLDMPLEGRIMVLDDLLRSVPSRRRRELLRNRDRLALEVEAWCVNVRGPSVDELLRYILPSWLERLVAAVDEALLARLPNVA